MKKLICKYNVILFVIAVSCGTACKKNAVVDGGLSKAEVNMTTYDFLKTHPAHMFDTTILLVDKAGIKDLINSSGTFFVPNNYTITNFLNAKRDQARQTDEQQNYTIDSLFKYFTPQMLRDSLAMYFFPQKITRDNLIRPGESYQTANPYVQLNISLETKNEYTVDGIITNKPQYIYLNKIVGAKDNIDADGNWSDPTGDVKFNDIKVRCQTTGIITTTGIVHVLENSHIWTYEPTP